MCFAPTTSGATFPPQPRCCARPGPRQTGGWARGLAAPRSTWHHVACVPPSRRQETPPPRRRWSTSNAGWSSWLRQRCTAVQDGGSSRPARGCDSSAPPSASGAGPGSAAAGLHVPPRVARHHVPDRSRPAAARGVVRHGGHGRAPAGLRLPAPHDQAARRPARRTAARGARAGRPRGAWPSGTLPRAGAAGRGRR